MSQHIYQTIPLVERSFFQKLFKQHPEENAVIELNNLLATRPINHIRQQDILDIERKYNLSLPKEFSLNLEEFYAVYLNYCLANKSLDAIESEHLRLLKSLLSLPDGVVDKLHIRLGQTVYRKSFEAAISNGRLSESEKARLNKLAGELKLPESLTDKISADTRTAFLKNYISGIIRDQCLSPDEERELNAITTSLNIQIKMDEQTKQQLAKLRLYWALENEALPVVQTDIALQRAEQCFIAIQNVSWYELRSVRVRTGYSGSSTSFKVAKGFYLRSGSYTPKSNSVDQMTLIDRGHLYLTNKRIIFTGLKKNSNIRLEKILGITPYTGGVEISKDAGKTPLLQFADRTDVFCVILERLLRERDH